MELDGHVLGEGGFLAGPEVFAGLGGAETEAGEVEVEGVGGVAVAADVDDGDGDGSALEIAGPDFDFAVRVGVAGLVAEWILVDGDDVFVGEDGGDLGLHLGEVVAGEKGSGEHGPHGEVGAVFFEREFAVADLEHVGVVPVAGACVGLES